MFRGPTAARGPAVEVNNRATDNAIAGWRTEPAERSRRIDDESIIGHQAAAEEEDTLAVNTDVAEGRRDITSLQLDICVRMLLLLVTIFGSNGRRMARKLVRAGTHWQ